MYLLVDYNTFKNYAFKTNAQVDSLEYTNDFEVYLTNGSFKLKARVKKGSAEESDFEINFKNVFNSLQDSEKKSLLSVEKPTGDFNTVSTHNLCEDGSPWTMIPPYTKNLVIDKAEIQFEHDLVLTPKTVELNYFIWHPSSTTPIIGKQMQLTKLTQMFELGNEHSHCPPISTEIPNGLTTIHFNYSSALTLYSARKDYSLAKIEIKIADQTPLVGRYCTISFITKEVQA